MTQTIPVVMIAADPLAIGSRAKSVSHPDANLTGLSLASPDLAGKRLELIRDIKPDIKAIAFLGLGSQAESFESQTASFVRETTEAARRSWV